MKAIELYTCFLTENADVVIVLPFIGVLPPKDPKVIYDGGENAILEKSKERRYLLDKLNEMVRPCLQIAKRVLIFEVNTDSQEIIRDYFAVVEHRKVICE